MRCFKNIVISSDGSVNFFYRVIKNTSYLTFNLHDDKNCNLYQKIKKSNVDSKHLQTYKKKYFK